MIRAIPLYAGYYVYNEITDYNLAELYGLHQQKDWNIAFGGYVEAAVPIGGRVKVRPGVVLTVSPRPSVEPRVRASWCARKCCTRPMERRWPSA